MQKVALKIREWVDEVDLIVTSPFVRAKDTAEILSQVFSVGKVLEAEELTPENPPETFLKWLKNHGRNHKSVMVVGHEPHLSSFISFVVARANHPIVELKKSGVACLEIESTQSLAPGVAHLNWLIQPRLIVD